MASPTTSNRLTSIRFNEFLPTVNQPGITYERTHDHIGRGVPADDRPNMIYLPGIGWQLKPIYTSRAANHETTDGQDGILSVAAGLATMASSFAETDRFGQQSILGVTYTGAPASGDPMISKQITAGDTFEQRLDADQDAFPSADTASDIVDLDRAYVTTSSYLATDNFQFRFTVPGSGGNVKGLCGFFFPGPASSTSDHRGTGQYEIKFDSDGRADLFELGYASGATDLTWKHRFSFSYLLSPNDNPTAHAREIWIVSDAHDDGTGKIVGSKMLFFCNAVPHSLIEHLVNVAITAAQESAPESVPTYRIPRQSQEPSTACQIRVDIRRDVRASFQVKKAHYPPTGSLKDTPFTLDCDPTGSEDFTFSWFGNVPTGSTLDAKLYDASTGIELTGSLDFTSGNGGQRTYTPNSGQRRYYVQYSLTSDGTVTPTIKNFTLTRSAIFEIPDVDTHDVTLRAGALPCLPGTVIGDVQITGASQEAADQAASVLIEDLIDDLGELLPYQARMPIKIETEYDSSHNKTTLFRGYVETADQERRYADKGQSYPSPDWRRYTLACSGEWVRLKQTLTPRRRTWAESITETSTSFRPMKVTDIVRELLGLAYPASMIDIPDIGIRLFGVDEDELQVQPGSPVDDIIIGLVRDYLGAWLIFDENAGTYGMWRLLRAKTAPYTILARFETNHPGAGKIPHKTEAYGTTVSGSQTIVKTFIRRRTDHKKRIAPEGNMVIVYGGANQDAASAEGSSSPALLTRTLVNRKSFNFDNLDTTDPNYPRPGPSNPDYLPGCVPIKVYDPSLSSQLAVDYVAYRIFRYACFSQEILTFTAPLIFVTDSTDTDQARPRMLRFYDMVEVWNGASYDTWAVVQCNPTYKKDRVQWASYQLVTSSQIDDYALAPTSQHPLATVVKAVNRSQGLSNRTQTNTQARGAVIGNLGNLLKLPEVLPTNTDPIQIGDTTAPEYGQSVFMWGVDSVGSSTHPIGGAA